MIIGLTGGSGCGKSLASQFFEKNGFVIFDFDKIARKVCSKGSDCLLELVEFFGDRILTDTKELDRRLLGSIVFGDEEKLCVLNKITHKYILKETENMLKKEEGKNIIFDAPLLFEAGLEKKCDYVICVLSDKEKRIERIASRDNVSKEYAKKRVESQKADSFYENSGDFVLYNNESEDKLYIDLANILRSITDEFKPR